MMHLLNGSVAGYRVFLVEEAVWLCNKLPPLRVGAHGLAGPTTCPSPLCVGEAGLVLRSSPRALM